VKLGDTERFWIIAAVTVTLVTLIAGMVLFGV